MHYQILRHFQQTTDNRATLTALQVAAVRQRIKVFSLLACTSQRIVLTQLASAQERIAAKMRQKLSSNHLTPENFSPAHVSPASAAVVSAGARGASGPAIAGPRVSPSAQPRPSSGPSDLELSLAVFGNSDDSAEKSRMSASIRSEVRGEKGRDQMLQKSDVSGSGQSTRALSSPSALLSSSRYGTSGSKAASTDAGSTWRASGAGGVQLSILEFRRLTAGGLPHPSNRTFIVTGRGLAGPLRVVQITPDGLMGTYVSKEDHEGCAHPLHALRSSE
jgi:hypothetical protein